MLKVQVMRLNKNGIMKSYTMKLRDTKENNLTLEKLAETAEDCAVDQLNQWK